MNYKQAVRLAGNPDGIKVVALSVPISVRGEFSCKSPARGWTESREEDREKEKEKGGGEKELVKCDENKEGGTGLLGERET